MKIDAKFACKLSEHGKGKIFSELDVICAHIKLEAELGGKCFNIPYISPEVIDQLWDLDYTIVEKLDETFTIYWN